ncbi:MAG: twin-arginine translocase TatA/TatE family subunit [Dehalococcoidia bacterium]|nr:MAG: twin-arginine translocase TatA/TatE family subunit [Dehalococcoidia bacterium]
MPLHGWEFLIIVVVVLIVFGVGKLPQTLGSLGKGVRSFRKAAAGEEMDIGLSEPKKEKDTSDLASTSS